MFLRLLILLFLKLIFHALKLIFESYLGEDLTLFDCDLDLQIAAQRDRISFFALTKSISLLLLSGCLHFGKNLLLHLARMDLLLKLNHPSQLFFRFFIAVI